MRQSAYCNYPWACSSDHVRAVEILCCISGFWEGSRCEWLSSFSFYVVIFVQLLSHVRLFAIPWTAVCQAPLSPARSQHLLKLLPIELVMPFNNLILCHPLLLLLSTFPSIRVFSSESALRIRWPKYWSFSFSISPSNEYSGLISFSLD